MTFRPVLLATALLAPVLVLLPGLATAQPRPAANAQAPAPAKERSGALGTLGNNNKDPIKIDADRLDVFDKEGKAVFTGNVVAVQAESTMRCSMLTVFYEQGRATAGAQGNQGAARQPGPAGGGDSSIKKIDCKGPVTVVSRTQTATSDNAVFDRAANKVYLIGNATLADGPNVTQGERVIYDLNTSIANVETAGPGGRVKALFVPGSGEPKPGATPAPAAAPAPAATPAAATPKPAAAPRPKPQAAQRNTGSATE
ncbi:MAG TPA: LptA/OstA family protein [Beijerinckiaceae bacterium]|jgi:lipopolysaccharide export system protein LptA